MGRAGTAWIVSLTFLVGCAHARSTAVKKAVAPVALVLVASERLRPNMLLRQRLHGRYGDKEVDLECVLQVSQGELTIVGLTPFGSRAFTLTQRGLTHSFTKYVDRELPFDPAHILDDVQRVFFRALPQGGGDLRHGIEAGERITERFSQGILLERRFERLDQNPPGAIVVTFEGPPAPLVPARVVIDNGWYGYRIEIDNLVQQSLP